MLLGAHLAVVLTVGVAKPGPAQHHVEAHLDPDISVESAETWHCQSSIRAGPPMLASKIGHQGIQTVGSPRP